MNPRHQWYKDPSLQRRMFLVMFLLTALYLAFLAVLWYARAPIGIIAIVMAVLALGQFFFSDKLVLASTHAKTVTAEQAPELHAMIERLCAQMDLPKPRIAMIDSNVPNALATGRGPKNAVVAVTTGIMNQLNRDEMQAVLAHELSHIKNRDVLVMAIASFFATVAGFITQWGLFLGMGGRRDDRGGGGLVILVYLASVVVALISNLILIPLLSRKRELAADRGGAVVTGQPAALESALVKISGRMNQIPERDLRAVEGSNAFFIIPAIRGITLQRITSTHPSLEERIEQLRQIQRQMEGVA